MRKVSIQFLATVVLLVGSAGCRIETKASALSQKSSGTAFLTAQMNASNAAGPALLINQVNTGLCSASNAAVQVSLTGFGPDVKGCTSYTLQAPARAGESVQCDDSKFVALRGSQDWEYSSSSDTWSLKSAFSKLQNHPYYVPGDFRLEFRSATNSAMGLVSVRNPLGDPNTCGTCVRGTGAPSDGALVIPAGYALAGRYASVAALKSAATAAQIDSCIEIDGTSVFFGFPPCINGHWESSSGGTSCGTGTGTGATPSPTPTSTTPVTGCGSKPADDGNTRQEACPSGQVGSITQSRSYVCSGSSWIGSWNQVSSTCTAQSGCSSASFRTFDHTGQYFDFTADNGSYTAVKLPPINPGKWAEIILFQSTATPSDLTSEVAISSCSGDFNVDAKCKSWGSTWSSTDIHAFTDPIAAYCYLTPGRTYFINIRHVKQDGTPSCPNASCAARIQYIGNL